MTTPTPGPELRKERLAADVKVTAVASLMGVSRQTVHGYERAADPGESVVRDYRAALARLRPNSVTVTPGEAVA